MSKNRNYKKILKCKSVVFFIALGVFFVIGLLFFCRPTVSEVEKRELTEFPEASLGGMLDGSFWHGVDLWYSDTYPLREELIELGSIVKSLYGERSTQFIPGQNDRPADEIPDVTLPDPWDDTDAPGTEPPETSPGTQPPETSPGTGTDGTTAPETQPPETQPPETQPPETAGQQGGNDTPTGEMSGSIYIEGNRAYGLYYFSLKNSERYAEIVNRAYERFGGDADVYCVIPPLNSGVLLSKSVTEKLGASDQQRAIAYMYSLMNKKVRTVDAFGALSAHKDEYIYFRTDHHWTARGAYYAYTAFAKAKGVTAHGLDMFEHREYPGFLGTSYSSSRSQALKNSPDTVEAFVPFGTNKMKMTQADGSEIAWNIVNDVSAYVESAKYSCFAGGDQPFAYAHNETIKDGSACVVIKDSFGNAFVPFLVDHYEYVYWIDYRYYKGSFSSLIKDYGIDDIIFCPNVQSANTDAVINMLDKLVES